MNQKECVNELSAMTQNQKAVYEVESYLEEKYEFRKNILSGKTEVKENPCEVWYSMTEERLNSIVRRAKKEGIGGNKSPRKEIEEYILSDAVEVFNPIENYLKGLPQWDGKNHVAHLFSRLPGITSEHLGWCATWLRSAVAHWLHLDTQHGNECVPILIGAQGCGKSTFVYRLLPPELRVYYLDHINFSNKFDSDMALTHNLLVNIDEFANMKESQQGKLKQTLSRVKVNGRPIFGRCQEERLRFASFIATTNNPRPLCDPTGSRRFLCLRIADGGLIDNQASIDYPQLYAQVMYELCTQQTPYWFSNEETARIQKANAPYQQTENLEVMLNACLRIPAENEQGDWMKMGDICERLLMQYPYLPVGNGTKVRIGQSLKSLGCQTKRTKAGQTYQLIALQG